MALEKAGDGERFRLGRSRLDGLSLLLLGLRLSLRLSLLLGLRLLSLLLARSHLINVFFHSQAQCLRISLNLGLNSSYLFLCGRW